MPNIPGQADHAAPKTKWQWWQYTEPARLRAIATAVVALATSLGIVLPLDLPGIAEAGIGVLAVVLPLIQGETTRAAVVSPQRADLIAAGRAEADLRTGPA